MVSRKVSTSAFQKLSIQEDELNQKYENLMQSKIFSPNLHNPTLSMKKLREEENSIKYAIGEIYDNFKNSNLINEPNKNFESKIKRHQSTANLKMRKNSDKFQDGVKKLIYSHADVEQSISPLISNKNLKLLDQSSRKSNKNIPKLKFKESNQSINDKNLTGSLDPTQSKTHKSEIQIYKPNVPHKSSKNLNKQNINKATPKIKNKTLQMFENKSILKDTKLALDLKKSTKNLNEYDLSRINNVLEGGLKDLKRDTDDINIIREKIIPNEPEFNENDVDKQIKRKASRMVMNLSPRNLRICDQVYDSLSDGEEDDNDQFDNHDYLIHPESNFKKTFDLILYTSIVFSILYLPLKLAFCHKMNLLFMKSIDIICDLLMILDIIINFFVPFTNDRLIVVFDKSLIIKNYFTGFFALDLICSIPFNTSLNFSLDNLDINRDIQLLFLIRFVKYLKTDDLNLKYLSNIFYKDNFKAFLMSKVQSDELLNNFVNFIVQFLVLIHLASCVWIYLATFNLEMNWVKKSKFDEYDPLELYITSSYFHFVSIFTIGYGTDIHSTNLIERVYIILFLIFGIGIYSLTISFLSNFAIDNEQTIKLNNNLEYLEQLKINYDLPDSLYQKIYRQIFHDFQINQNEKSFLLDDLQGPVRNEIICVMNKELIENFKFFKTSMINTNREFIAKMIQILRASIAYKGEHLIKKNDLMEETIFVKQGVLSFELNYKSQVLNILNLRRYEHFGETLMVLNKRCPINIKVISVYVDLFVMRKFEFMFILFEYSKIFDKIFQQSMKNLLRLKKLIRQKKKQVDKKLKLEQMGSSYHSNSSKEKNLINEADDSHLFSSNKIPEVNAISNENNKQINEGSNNLSVNKDISSNEKSLKTPESNKKSFLGALIRTKTIAIPDSHVKDKPKKVNIEDIIEEVDENNQVKKSNIISNFKSQTTSIVPSKISLSLEPRKLFGALPRLDFQSDDSKENIDHGKIKIKEKSKNPNFYKTVTKRRIRSRHSDTELKDKLGSSSKKKPLMNILKNELVESSFHLLDPKKFYNSFFKGIQKNQKIDQTKDIEKRLSMIEDKLKMKLDLE